MPQPLRKTNPIILPLNNSLIALPAPSNLSSWWNFGSLLGLCLLIQMLTGTFLAMHYIPHISQAFDSIMHLSRDVSHGWLARTTHATGSSCFFMCLYLHIGRSIYYSSYLLQETWNIGVILLLLIMMTAFLGYVLPWGQMSFWGATVITNLLSAIPYIGTSLVQWIWGGYAVDSATLTRFFALHFITPFITAGVTVTHFMFLHQTGSNNPLGMNSNPQKIPFHSYYSLKDLVGALILLLLLTFLALFHPNLLTDPENSIKANPLATPIHIMPEWYFLWAYAILRSIPNKLGGVMLMFIAIMMLLILPFMHKQKQSGQQFHPPSQIIFWTLVSTMALLTWIGMKPVEPPFTWIGLALTTIYFILYPLIPFLANTWESLYMN